MACLYLSGSSVASGSPRLLAPHVLLSVVSRKAHSESPRRFSSCCYTSSHLLASPTQGADYPQGRHWTPLRADVEYLDLPLGATSGKHWVDSQDACGGLHELILCMPMGSDRLAASADTDIDLLGSA